MIIGSFTYDHAQDTFTGFILTFTTSLEKVMFRPTGKDDGKAPSYQVEAYTLRGTIEIGAAWKRTGENGEYISVKLDDPMLGSAVNCGMIGRETGEHILVWNREKRDAKKAA
jgi:uncharacterized protein (DUF736 family)